ncbi:unnamed protein product [Ceutorhynchus assimilis]|uniref:Uncharacterized protein n=1 Tax=Ceutorhynchus assimilis TaxID=467358 RepID=A0A9N9QKG1_9CUCU|nr:unnamed protein product [Ceutorhynchus assimilis]
MFSKTIIFSALVALVVSTSPSANPTPQVPVVSQDFDLAPDGSYKFNFESADGIKQEQHGAPKVVDKDVVVEVVAGSASYTDLEGGKHEISYVADENGYQPIGADIPVAPKIPPMIARALQYIADHPHPEEKQ